VEPVRRITGNRVERDGEREGDEGGVQLTTDANGDEALHAPEA
jgi:hypothetical protein